MRSRTLTHALAALLATTATLAQAEAPQRCFGELMGADKHSTVRIGCEFREPRLDFDFMGREFQVWKEANLGAWRRNESSARSVFELGAALGARHWLNGRDFFIEGSFGIKLLSHARIDAGKTLSTAFQFSESLGIGTRFGVLGEQEVSARYTHISNAGIKHPNPGVDGFGIRYSIVF